MLAVVGEEDETDVELNEKPYRVGDLIIPEKYYEILERIASDIDTLATEISDSSYKERGVFQRI